MPSEPDAAPGDYPVSGSFANHPCLPSAHTLLVSQVARSWGCDQGSVPVVRCLLQTQSGHCRETQGQAVLAMGILGRGMDLHFQTRMTVAAAVPSAAAAVVAEAGTSMQLKLMELAAVLAAAAC